MQCVYSFDAKDQPTVKKVLEADAFDENSFARVGYVLKSSESLSGVPPGKYFIFFEAEDARAKLLIAKLEETKCCAAVAGDVRDKIIQQISSDQESAASGFGSLFG